MVLTTKITEIIEQTTKIVIRKGEPTLYEFNIRERKLTFPSEELLTPKMFRIAWLDNFHELLTMPQQEWSFFVRTLLEQKDKIVITEEEEITPARVLVENLLSDINNSAVFGTPENALDRGKVWYDKETREVLVPNATITAMAKSSEQPVSLHKIRGALSEYLNGNSKKVRIGNQTYRFWRFKPEKLMLNLDNIVELETDEEENNGDNKNIWTAGDGQNRTPDKPDA